MAATYDTGFLSTPSDLLTAANATNAQIQAIDSAIDGNDSLPQDWWDSFQSFRSQWLSFFSSNFAGAGLSGSASGSIWTARASWLTSDVEGQLASYQQQAATWAHQAAGYGVTLPGAILEPSSDNLPSWLPSSTTVVVVLGIVLALMLTEKLL